MSVDSLPFFGSDNQSGAHPKILAALMEANSGFVGSYGVDPLTKKAEERWAEALGGEARVNFLFNGTAANVVGLTTVLRSYEGVICGRRAHISEDECGAPERVGGLKILEAPLDGMGKLTVEAAKPFLAARGDVHHIQPRAISITQPTEQGTVYTLEEMQRLAEFARRENLYFHVDGARFGNAATHLAVPLRSIARDAGVDFLSLGGTKAGLIGADAFVVFRKEWFEPSLFYRKQLMQLASKMRFLSAQFLAYLEGDLWREIANQSLTMASHLGSELQRRGITPLYPVESNAVFVELPEKLGSELAERFHFYRWETARPVFRLMTSFATTQSHVSQLLQGFDA